MPHEVVRIRRRIDFGADDAARTALRRLRQVVAEVDARIENGDAHPFAGQSVLLVSRSRSAVSDGEGVRLADRTVVGQMLNERHCTN